MVNRLQVLAARAWLEMSQQDLAEASAVSKRTIAHFEAGDRTPHDRTIRDIQAALEARGVVFLFKNGVGVGISVDVPDTAGR